MIKQFIGSMTQKEKSLKQLYSLIKEHGPISKSDLIKLTGLKQTTCARLIEELLEINLIIECGYGESSGGRKPFMYQINPDVFKIFGVDISRMYTKVLLMDLSLTVIDEARMRMNKNSTPEVTIQFIETQIKNMLNKHHLTVSDILGIGIGTVGPLDRDQGVILNPMNFPSPGWENIFIRDELNKKLDMKVLIDNGGNTALLAEYKNELFKTFNNVVHVTKGMGTRTGFIIDGRLARGSDKLGMYGQGHMVVDLHGRKCICGAYGCVHAYSSIPAIKQDVINLLKQGRDSILRKKFFDIESIEFEDICQAVKEMDPLCSQVVKDAATYTGVGLSNLIHVIGPDLVILSGPTYTNMDLFYEEVTKTASNRCKLYYPDHQIVFSRGNLGENAASIGAGEMVFNYYLD